MAIVRGIKDQFPFKADRNRGELAAPLDSQGQALARGTDSSQRGVECALEWRKKFLPILGPARANLRAHRLSDLRAKTTSFYTLMTGALQ
jgi:hypothetical protein